jgi:hypothetical protein
MDNLYRRVEGNVWGGQGSSRTELAGAQSEVLENISWLSSCLKVTLPAEIVPLDVRAVTR